MISHMREYKIQNHNRNEVITVSSFHFVMCTFSVVCLGALYFFCIYTLLRNVINRRTQRTAQNAETKKKNKKKRIVRDHWKKKNAVHKHTLKTKLVRDANYVNSDELIEYNDGLLFVCCLLIINTIVCAVE